MKNRKKIKIVALVSTEWSKTILENTFKDKRNRIFISLIISKNIIFNKNNYKNIIYLRSGRITAYVNKIRELKPDIILTYGWSYYLPKSLREIAPCLILHPSKLPRYRGGSPIQNQIIRDVKNSAVSILIANDDIDTGPIIFQKKLNLEGYLDQIFERLIKIGTEANYDIFSKFRNNNLKIRKQNEKNASYFKRRSPEMSEIFIKDFKEKEAKYFYNLVRGLQDPYPECFIKCKNNTKLFLKKVYIK